MKIQNWLAKKMKLETNKFDKDQIEYQTAKAVLIVIGTKQYWIPKSQILYNKGEL